MAYARFRSRNTGPSPQTTVTDRLGVVKYSQPLPTRQKIDTMSDFVIPGYKSSLISGFYPIHPLESSRFLIDATRRGLDSKYADLKRFIPPVQYLSYSSTLEEEPVGFTRFYLNTPSPTTNYLDVKGCVTHALSLIGGFNSAWYANDPVVPLASVLLAACKNDILKRTSKPEFAFGEPLAEVRETIRLIRDPFAAIKRTLRAFSRKSENIRYRTSKEQARALANNWAEVSWAVLPNLRTIDDAIQASANYFHKTYSPAYRRFSSSRKADGRTSRPFAGAFNFQYAGGYSAPSYSYKAVCVRSTKIEVSAGVRCFNDDDKNLSSMLGLRGRDIPGVLWDVFPLSFLVDRLVNVSGYLQAASNFMSTHVKFCGGWESTRVTTYMSRRVDSFYPIPIPGWTFWINPVDAKPWVTETFSFNRRSWVPTIRDVAPPVYAGKLLSSLKNTADVAAVLALKTQRLPGYQTLEQSTSSHLKHLIRKQNSN